MGCASKEKGVLFCFMRMERNSLKEKARKCFPSSQPTGIWNWGEGHRNYDILRDWRSQKHAVRILKVYSGAWFHVTPPYGQLGGRSERER